MRAYFLDRIRVILTILVIAHHSAITYGASGQWFVRLSPGDTPAAFGLTVFAALAQAFVIGYFFLIAGYLTPVSYDRKGRAAYSRDRLLRLGVPILVFGLVIGPLTVAIAEARGFGGLSHWIALVTHPRFVVGPMWFVLALLVFSLAYIARRRFVPIRPRPRLPVPPRFTWFAAAFGVGLAALAIRWLAPRDIGIPGFEIGSLAASAFLFVAGCVGERHGWLERIKRRHALPWLVALAVGVPLFALVLMASRAHGVDLGSGFSFLSLFQAFWEPVAAWGVIAGSLWYAVLRWNMPDRRWTYLARQSYGVFILHPPVLVATALLMEPIPLPSPVKFLLLTVLGTTLSFVLAAAFRRIRLVRAVI
ncbi:MAG: acyltransferase family protein [Rhizobiaceae bacterium]|nr:acyltransferase family protein [Rhizobiaceae bacterium]